MFWFSGVNAIYDIVEWFSMGFFFFSYYYLELGAILLRFSVHKENCIKLIYTVSHILLMSFLRQVLSRAEMKKKKNS